MNGTQKKVFRVKPLKRQSMDDIEYSTTMYKGVKTQQASPYAHENGIGAGVFNFQGEDEIVNFEKVSARSNRGEASKYTRLRQSMNVHS